MKELKNIGSYELSFEIHNDIIDYLLIDTVQHYCQSMGTELFYLAFKDIVKYISDKIEKGESKYVKRGYVFKLIVEGIDEIP